MPPDSEGLNTDFVACEQFRGGIIIPDTAKEKPQEGEVVAVGEGKYRDDGTRQTLDVRVGDRVLFGKYVATPPSIARRRRPHHREFPTGYSSAGCSPVWGHESGNMIHGQNAKGTGHHN